MAVLMKDVREAMESLMIERGLADEDGDGMPDDGAFYGNEGDLRKLEWDAVVRAARLQLRALAAERGIRAPAPRTMRLPRVRGDDGRRLLL